MVGININKKQTSNLLKCSAYKKLPNYKGNEDLLYSTSKLGIFFANVVSTIKSEESNLGSSFKHQNNYLTIQTADSVEEIQNGDIIYIECMNTYFIVEDKEYVFYNSNGRYMQFKGMNKITRFNLKGLI